MNAVYVVLIRSKQQFIIIYVRIHPNFFNIGDTILVYLLQIYLTLNDKTCCYIEPPLLVLQPAKW